MSAPQELHITIFELPIPNEHKTFCGGVYTSADDVMHAGLVGDSPEFPFAGVVSGVLKEPKK